MKKDHPILIVALVVLPVATAAQVAVDPAPAEAYVSRAELQAQLDRLMMFATSPAYTEVLRGRIRREAQVIETRLSLGDFQVGDRILLSVDNQLALSDTFLVDQGPVLTLPTIGDVPLAGILRSELKGHLTGYLETFLRNPIVRARGLVRVAVLGAVGQPGFYMFPGEMMLTDAIMAAGGPGQRALIDGIVVERGETRVWEADALRQAIIEGTTFDQLNVRAGDQIVVPQRAGGLGGAESALRSLLLILTIPVTIVALTSIFN